MTITDAQQPPLTAAEIIATWKSDPRLRAEFQSIARWEAYLRAAASGRARILGRAAE